MGTPGFLSQSINTKADKDLWVALVDREKLVREILKKSWEKEGEKQRMKAPSVPNNGIHRHPGLGPPELSAKSFGLQ